MPQMEAEYIRLIRIDFWLFFIKLNTKPTKPNKTNLVKLKNLSF